MAEVRDKWCVSLFMPVATIDPQKNRIRLRNLRFEAERKLLELDVDPTKVHRMLAPFDLIIENTGFWANRKSGFAAFVTNESFVWYSVPYDLQELVVVTDRLHLKPLLHRVAESESSYLLTLSQKHIKFYEFSKWGLHEILLRGMPRSIYLGEEDNEGSALQMHSAGSGPAIFHGHGTNQNKKKARIDNTLRKVNKIVADFLKNEDAPLVLAGVTFLHGNYQEVNTYPNLVKDGIAGNVDKLDPTELLVKALALVDPIFDNDRRSALEAFKEKFGTGLASENLIEVFGAAIAGRIETLFVPVGKQQWGSFDLTKMELNIHERQRPGDKDLLCVVSTKTLIKGGKIFAVQPEQMPGKSNVAAVLRY